VRLQPDALADNSWHRIGNYGFVYSGTSVWFHDLEERIGKEALERAFQAYYRRWKFRHPGTADLEQSLIESTGKPELIREFFQTAVYSSEALDDRIVELESDEQLPPLGW